MKSIEAKNIENEYGIPWQVVYGISNNTRAFWSLSNAVKNLDMLLKMTQRLNSEKT
ncbi:MAG: hypothetical protein CM1200mP38_3300 [Dehalococcoidia bacterium]|nr:MAG: hypothetical protein CM1200mP38_3300 [Dehalococcoidia bacterium]